MKGLSARRVRGPVTVKEISGFGSERPWRVRTCYPSIDDFARRMSYHRYIFVSPQGRIVPSDTIPGPDGAWIWNCYRSFEVYDLDGVILPAYMVIEDISAFRRESEHVYRISCWKKRGWPYPPESYFRDGPLPGSRRGLRRPKDYKRIGTFAEVRHGEACKTDMLEELPPVRLRGKRSRSMIGDNDWDGVWSMRSEDRSWKRHRATQWRA